MAHWEIKMHHVSTEVHGKSNIFQDAEVKDSTIHPLLTCGIWKGIIHLHALHYVHNMSRVDWNPLFAEKNRWTWCNLWNSIVYLCCVFANVLNNGFIRNYKFLDKNLFHTCSRLNLIFSIALTCRFRYFEWDSLNIRTLSISLLGEIHLLSQRNLKLGSCGRALEWVLTWSE